MITYAKEDYHLVYTTKLISIASGVCVFVYFLIFALPFLLVYATNGIQKIILIFVKDYG